jgi:hypothetical protein
MTGWSAAAAASTAGTRAGSAAGARIEIPVTFESLLTLRDNRGIVDVPK